MLVLRAAQIFLLFFFFFLFSLFLSHQHNLKAYLRPTQNLLFCGRTVSYDKNT